MADIEQLQQALKNTEGRTPQEVLDAFLPKGKKIGKFDLVELTFGHALFLAQEEHPLSKGQLDNWEPHDTAIALFAFTRSSVDLKKSIDNGSFLEDVYEVAEQIPFGETSMFTSCLMAHYLCSIQTGIEMSNPKSDKAQKKTRLAGFSQRLRGFVASIIGRPNTSPTS